MKTLDTARIGQVYYIACTDNAQLRDMGCLPDREIALISFNGDNAIVKLENTRLALSLDFLRQINIKTERAQEKLLSLSDLNVGDTGIVRLIDSTGEMKRRLMDMGITRGTSIYIHKLAPLGDPMELHLRGYSLSLRKADAQKIKVLKSETTQDL
jgi:ferrous iron transport protein A